MPAHVPARFTLAAALPLLLGLTACTTDDSGGGGTSADAGSDPACGQLDCGGHGTCHIVNQLPACTCDDGYELSGLECVPPIADAPEAPDGFTCPAPGPGTEPLFATLTANRWYYDFNDRNCGEPGWKTIYDFRPDGVFVFGAQFHATAATKAGDLDYGCYTYAITQVDGVDAISLSYTYTNQSSRNCTTLGSLADPPCTGVLAVLEGKGLVQAAERADSGEVHVFRPVTDEACKWCNSAPTCCAENSWIADSSGPICP